jgi:predicted PurR-regulated permease PerM
VIPERVIRFRARTVLAVLGIVLSVAVLLQIIVLARQVLTWIFIAMFLALALNPLVDWLQRHGVRRRGLAVGVTYLIVFIVFGGLGAAFIPTLVTEVNDFAEALPDYIDDLIEGRGRLGFLEEDYQIVERVREAVEEGGVGRLLGYSGTAFAVTRGVITAIVAIITIAVLTFFMLLEGPGWIERLLTLLPERSRARWRAVGYDIYRTVGGFVTGAVLIALIAGITSSILLSVVGVPYAIALGLLVALLDFIPLAGAAIATVLVSTIAFLTSSIAVGIVVLVFFVIYQQVENHVLYPLVYSRTVQLSPLVILIAVLIGASLAGILGALAAIPVAGAIQVILIDWLKHRRGVVSPAEIETPVSEIEPAETHL